MSKPDLNLLVTLSALLNEGSVVRAARRLQLSPSATSRSLARLRKTMGDPLLVRAGSKLVLTPRALELQTQIGRLVDDAQAILRPQQELVPASLERSFTLRACECFVETFGPCLIARVMHGAPKVQLRFLHKADAETGLLREGSADIEIGALTSTMDPEVRAKGLYRERFVGAVRRGHALSAGEVTLARYLAHGHVAIFRHSLQSGPVDRALADVGKERKISVVLGGFSTALAVARASDFIATVPEKSTAGLRSGMRSFPLPFPAPEVTVSMLWHPRLNSDPANRWLRQCIWETCAKAPNRQALPSV